MGQRVGRAGVDLRRPRRVVGARRAVDRGRRRVAVGVVAVVLLASGAVRLPRPDGGGSPSDPVETATCDGAPCAVVHAIAPRPQPAPITVELPVDLAPRFLSWRLTCGAGAVRHGPVDDAVLRIPDVPPAACTLVLAGPGSPRLSVSAGDHLVCRHAGTLWCADSRR